MSGGIIGWEGGKATGLETVGLEYFIEGNFTSAVSMAYAMEKGLKKFYLLLAEKTESPENTELLTYMARLEDGHMAKIRGQYSEISLEEEKSSDAIAEGGVTVDDFLKTFEGHLTDISSVIQVGMMFESQAYDLYSRLAHKTDDSTLKSFYLNMAQEEKNHLERLGKELSKRLA